MAKQVAEKLEASDEVGGKRPSGAEALSYFGPLAARLKSCPDTFCNPERVFPQLAKPVPFKPTRYAMRPRRKPAAFIYHQK